jgi:hypothetical protein
MRTYLPIILGLATLALPLAALLWLALARRDATSIWLLRLLFAGAVVFLAFFAGGWVFTSVHLRYIPVALMPVAAWLSLHRRRRLPREERRLTHPLALLGWTLILCAPLSLDLGIIQGWIMKTHPLDLDLPFRQGTYVVLQGGNSLATNPFHHRSRPHPPPGWYGSGGPESEWYAVDLVELNDFGNRAGALVSRDARDYMIFGDSIYAPCAGMLVEAVDTLPEMMVGETDTEHPEGNRLSISLPPFGPNVLISPIMRGSIPLRPGDWVQAGEYIGRVGNSGSSMEPHLHIEAREFAFDAGPFPVPIRFGRRLLSMNDVITAGEADGAGAPAEQEGRPRVGTSR